VLLTSDSRRLLLRRLRWRRIGLLLIWILIWSRRRLLILGLRFLNFLTLVQNLYAGTEAFVVFILHDLADVNVPRIEVQGIVARV
jgi:hypothetical protein